LARIGPVTNYRDFNHLEKTSGGVALLGVLKSLDKHLAKKIECACRRHQNKK